MRSASFSSSAFSANCRACSGAADSSAGGGEKQGLSMEQGAAREAYGMQSKSGLKQANARTQNSCAPTFTDRTAISFVRFHAKKIADGVSKPCLPCLETLPGILKRKCDRHSRDRQKSRSPSCPHTSTRRHLFAGQACAPLLQPRLFAGRK